MKINELDIGKQIYLNIWFYVYFAELHSVGLRWIFHIVYFEDSCCSSVNVVFVLLSELERIICCHDEALKHHKKH